MIMAAVKKENLGKAFGFHNIGGSASNTVTPLLAVATANVLGGGTPTSPWQPLWFCSAFSSISSSAA